MAWSLRDLVADDHVRARVDRAVELGWLRAELADCYAAGVGRPWIDPEAAVRLMLAGPLPGIVHDRRRLREAQVHIAIRWFAGYGLMQLLAQAILDRDPCQRIMVWPPEPRRPLQHSKPKTPRSATLRQHAPCTVAASQQRRQAQRKG